MDRSVGLHFSTPNVRVDVALQLIVLRYFSHTRVI